MDVDDLTSREAGGTEAGEVAMRVVRVAAGSVPLAGSALSELVDYLWKRWQQPKAEAYLREVAHEAAVQAWSHDLLDDAANVELLAHGLHAAMRADSEAKARALGKVAASGVGGERPVDEARLVIASLARIDEPHIRVLTALAAPRPGGLGFPEGAVLYGQVSESLVLERVPGIGHALGAVMSVLESEGLAVCASRDPYADIAGTEWTLTRYGMLLLEYVTAQAATSPNACDNGEGLPHMEQAHRRGD